MYKKSWLVDTGRPYTEAPVKWDFSENNNIRIIEVTTAPENFTKITITRNSCEECDAEFSGQLSDGFFENERIIKFFEI